MLKDKRILCLDVGAKRIGLATCDKTATLACSLANLERQSLKRDLENLKKIIRDHRINLLIVGLPLNLDGTQSQQTREVADFIQKLEKKFSVPVKTWDERLSSKQAEAVLIKANLSRKKRKKLVDKISAQLILQSYLDYCSQLGCKI